MARTPNLVFIFSDQQSHDMLGAYGLSDVSTPNLDALAEGGILFEHCVSNAPVCTPARGMLISGQHPLWNNAYVNDRRLLPEIGESFAEVLGRAGYQNGYVGKWHLYGGDRDRPIPPGPDRHGFDALFLSNNCAVNYDPENAFFWNGNEKELFGTWEAAGQTEQALKFLDGVDPSEPFSLFVSYHPPHNHFGGDVERYSQFDAPAEYKEQYDPADIRLRPTVPDNERTRLMMQGYLAMCSEVDDNVGRILAKLEERGVADNTIVVYTSDHGETFGAFNNHWHKCSPEDVSVRVPLVLKLPGHEVVSRRSELLVGTLDLMPTLLGLMGLDVPETCHGVDLSSAIREGDDDAVESVPLFYFSAPWRGVYTKKWTYSIENIDRDGGQAVDVKSDVGRTTFMRRLDTLYNRDDDPHQLRNLFGIQKRPGVPGTEEIQAELHALTVAWLERFEDPFLTQTETKDALADWDGRPIDRLRGMQSAQGPMI